MVYMEIVICLVIGFLVQGGLHIWTKYMGYEMDRKYHRIGYLGSLAIWLVAFLRFDVSWTGLVLALVCSVLLTTSLIDMKYKELPDEYNLVIALLGGCFVLMYIDYWERLLFGGLIAFLIYFVLMAITGSMGAGDVKMSFGIGLFIGIILLPKWFIYTFLFGSIFAIILVIIKKKKKEDVFPFGPFMALSAIYLILFQI